MKTKRFNEIVKRRTEHSHALLIPKGEEYARNGDRLHNFKVQAQMGIDGPESPERALWGDLRKHIASLMDIIRDLDTGIIPSQKTMDDKFDDLHNYAYLVEGLIEERRDKEIAKNMAIVGAFQKALKANRVYTPKTKRKDGRRK